MHARVASYEVPEGRLGEAVESFREAARKIEALEGFERGYILLDEDGGRLVTVPLWTSLSALEATETRASILRQQAVRAVEGSVRSVEQFEVAEKLAPAAEHAA